MEKSVITCFLKSNPEFVSAYKVHTFWLTGQRRYAAVWSGSHLDPTDRLARFTHNGSGWLARFTLCELRFGGWQGSHQAGKVHTCTLYIGRAPRMVMPVRDVKSELLADRERVAAAELPDPMAPAARREVLEQLAEFRQRMAGRWSGTSAELLAEARADRR